MILLNSSLVNISRRLSYSLVICDCKRRFRTHEHSLVAAILSTQLPIIPCNIKGAHYIINNNYLRVRITHKEIGHYIPAPDCTTYKRVQYPKTLNVQMSAYTDRKSKSMMQHFLDCINQSLPYQKAKLEVSIKRSMVT